MPFACGVDDVGMPDAEAKARLDRALEIAWCLRERVSKETGLRAYDTSVMIFLGANMPECTQKYGISSLAESAKMYLVSQGWPAYRIVMNPKGYSTMVETMAFREYLQKSGYGYACLHFVTSWLHISRVYAVCRTIFGFNTPMKFYASPCAFKGRQLVHFLAREAIALPRSIFMAWRAVRNS
ncbi:MAG: ElyC/SanA/YdcF family protein [bacterium]|nr:ElyC/SanA/YdcF family protein [bacterium]